MRFLVKFLVLLLVSLPAVGIAHPGGVSKKDGCHRDNAAGERHYHVEDTADRAGECIVTDGAAYRVPAPVACEPEVIFQKSVDVQAFEDTHKRVLAEIRQALDRPPQVVEVKVPTPALKATTEQCRQLRTEFRQHYDRWGDRSEEVALVAINQGCW